MIGRSTRFRENDDLPRFIARSSRKEKPLGFFNARALITSEILCSRDAQCNNSE